MSGDTDIRGLAWSDQDGLLLTYRTDSIAYLAQFDPLLVFQQAIPLSDPTKQAILPNLSLNAQNGRILTSWIKAHSGLHDFQPPCILVRGCVPVCEPIECFYTLGYF